MELTKEEQKELDKYAKKSVYSYSVLLKGYILLDKNINLLEGAEYTARKTATDLLDVIMLTID